MDAYDDPSVQDVVIMSSAQVGKSEILLNIIGHIITNQPGPILSLNPTLDMAETFSKDRVAPMLRDTPILAERSAAVASRDHGNTILYKQFIGGQLTMAGANSPASLASRPIRVVLADEVDRYPISAGTEGDPLALAEKRTVNFWNRKRVKVSTPTVKGASRIEKAYNQSDKRRFYVPCPHCGEMQTLVWAQVKWDVDPSKAWYVCPHCGCIIDEGQKREAVSKGEWIGSAPFTGVAGFHINELYSPWRTLGDVAKAFLAAKDNPHELKTWVNISLGELWEDSKDTLEATKLAERAEDYRLATAPAEALLITGGADVQKDRIEAYLWGFGPGEESWVLDRQVFSGNPSEPEVWAALLEYFEQPIQHARGAQIVARCVAIDSGHATQEVYHFCRRHSYRRLAHGLQQFIAIKGQGDAKAVISKPSPQDIDRRGEKIKKGVQLFMVGVSIVKDTLYGRLEIVKPGPGYVHFSTDLAEDFYDQLTAERNVTKYVKGFPKREWILPEGRRNEALDCAVYAYAAASLVGLNRAKDPFWDSRRRQMTTSNAPPTSSTPSTPTPAAAPEPVTPNPPMPPPAPPAARRRPQSPPRSNWVKTW
jgi:phage terminase large subunit GpA-like protein